MARYFGTERYPINAWLVFSARTVGTGSENRPSAARSARVFGFSLSSHCWRMLGSWTCAKYSLGDRREESGPKARPRRPEWADPSSGNAQGRDVAFFFKQWGVGAQTVSDIGSRRMAACQRSHLGEMPHMAP